MTFLDRIDRPGFQPGVAGTRILAGVLGVVLATGGCAGGRSLTLAGAGAMVAGGALALREERDHDLDSAIAGADVGHDRSARAFGLVVLTMGVFMMTGGLVADHGEPEGASVLTGVDGLTLAPPAAVTVPREPMRVMALPGFAGRPDTQRQLAVQLATAARGGHCVAARLNGRELAKLDPEFHAEIIASDEPYARCVARE
jgi:hypothetical protein